ncbi:MAG: alcohol dehydrogenase catalytic domain-containing protein [Bacteriovoracaceae bacterium]
MKSLFLNADLENGKWKNPKLSWQESTIPKIGEQEVLIEVKACGICGTDLHCTQTHADGSLIYSGPIQAPVILGHEFSGKVIEMGKAVTKVRTGEFITSEGLIGCGVCTNCCGGFPNQCRKLQMVGINRPGALTKYIAIHERHIWSLEKVLDKLGDEKKTALLGTLVEPLAVCYNAIFIQASGITPGENVAIFGAGPIGLSSILLAKISGAGTIIVFEPIKSRRILAKELGADYVYDSLPTKNFYHEAIMNATDGVGVDMQIECSGNFAQIMPEIQNTLTPGGKLIFLSRTGESLKLSFDHFISNANKLIGSRGHVGGNCFPKIISLIEKNRLNLEPLITTILPMSQAIDAFTKAKTLEDGKIVMLQDL